MIYETVFCSSRKLGETAVQLIDAVAKNAACRDLNFRDHAYVIARRSNWNNHSNYNFPKCDWCIICCVLL